MGRDKAAIPLAGVPMLDRTIAILRPLFSELFISVRHQRNNTALPQLRDPEGAVGPIAGIIAALRVIKQRWLFVAPCDAPLLTPALIRGMASRRHRQDAVIAEISGLPQPLIAFYAADCLPRMETQAAAGRFSLQQLLRQLEVTVVDETTCRSYDPDLLSFADVDTPEAAARAEHKLRPGGHR